MTKQVGARQDIYVHGGGAAIDAVPDVNRRGGVVLRFRWNTEESAINVYLTTEQARDAAHALAAALLAQGAQP